MQPDGNELGAGWSDLERGRARFENEKRRRGRRGKYRSMKQEGRQRSEREGTSRAHPFDLKSLRGARERREFRENEHAKGQPARSPSVQRKEKPAEEAASGEERGGGRQGGRR